MSQKGLDTFGLLKLVEGNQKYVIVGSNSIIMSGVTIGEGSSVGALSYVNKNLESWCVYDGKPIRKICKRKKNMLDKYKSYTDEN